ncbi:MAG: hypothetical protein WCO56_11195 [Verrucomicrobiota bacterium]
MKRVCVQCGSNPGFAPVYLEAARELGRVLGRQRLAGYHPPQVDKWMEKNKVTT